MLKLSRYCPNLTNEERIPFKNNFNKMVDQRTRELIKLGRQVIVLGDLVSGFTFSLTRFDRI